ncbi:MAG: hypothetical protein WBF88_10460 [Pusillimonas sp.]
MNVKSFEWVIDLNHDGVYSTWEFWEAVKWVYRLPGNLLLEGLGHTPYLSSALGIRASEATGYGSLNGGLATSLSLLLWVIVIFGILTLLSPTADEDDTNTALDPAQALIGMNAPPFARQIQGPAKEQDGSPAVHHGHAHLPVSRASYAVPGKKPVRHKRHRRLVIT